MTAASRASGKSVVRRKCELVGDAACDVRSRAAGLRDPGQEAVVDADPPCELPSAQVVPAQQIGKDDPEPLVRAFDNQRPIIVPA